MSRRARIVLFLPAAAILGAVLVWGFAGLPDFGHYRGAYGYVVNRIAVPQRHTTNAVAAVTFDYRGFDTLGEELILFGAVTGVALLLRQPEPDAETDLEESIGSDALRLVGLLMVGPAILLGLWVVAFGYVTPGGGFQGGVALAGGGLLLYLAGRRGRFLAMAPKPLVELVEGVGAAGYVVVGLVALASGLAFLTNLFDPGRTGTLISGGSIPLLSWAAGLEVWAANLLLYSDFLEHHSVRLARGDL